MLVTETPRKPRGTISKRTRLDSPEPTLTPSKAAAFAAPDEAQIYKLPTELICLIPNFLDPYSAACFTIASKYIYKQLGDCWLLKLRDCRRKSYTLNEYHIQFLALFDGNRPDHFLCTYCHQYHPRDRLQEKYPRAEAPGAFDVYYNNYPACLRFIALKDRNYYVKSGTLSDGNWSRKIWWESIRLVLRSDKFGPDHGIPVSALECTYESRPSSIEGWFQFRHAKIIDRHLVMKLDAIHIGSLAKNPNLIRAARKLVKTFTVMSRGDHWDAQIPHVIRDASSQEPRRQLRKLLLGKQALPCQWKIWRSRYLPVDTALTASSLRTLSEDLQEALVDLLVKEATEKPDESVGRDRLAEQLADKAYDAPVIIITRWIDFGTYDVYPSSQYSRLYSSDLALRNSPLLSNIQQAYESESMSAARSTVSGKEKTRPLGVE